MPVRAHIAVASVIAATIVGGCTNQPSAPVDASAASVPSASTPAPTQPSPSATPSDPAKPGDLVAPASPAELSRTDEVGAGAAAAYFVSLYAYVMQTGDTATWAAMSGEPCGFCRRIKEDAEEMRNKGETYLGGGIKLSDLQVSTQDELIGGYPVDARFVQEPVMHAAGDGTVLTKTDGDSGVVQIDTLHTGGSWKILAVVVKDG